MNNPLKFMENIAAYNAENIDENILTVVNKIIEQPDI